MDINQKLHLEQQWHESEDFARDDSSLIVGVYASGVFDEAEAWHLAALGDVAVQHVLDYGCGTGETTAHLLGRGARVTGFDISVGRRARALIVEPVVPWLADGGAEQSLLGRSRGEVYALERQQAQLPRVGNESGL